MKQKYFLTALLLMLAGLQTAWAEKHEFVDLGLPSGTLWATTNVGAINPADYGDYFAWGETQPKSNYTWENYRYCYGTSETLTKYCTDASYGTVDNKTELDPQDDAATVNWGDVWQTPSMDQWGELLNENYVTQTYTSMTGKEGLLNYGLQITSKQNGNSIFLPASGTFYNSGVSLLDTYWKYWTNNLLLFNGQNQSEAGSENLYYEDNKIRFLASVTN